MTEVAEPVLLDSRDVEITEKDIKEALKYPDSFGYFGPNKEMFKTWSIGPVIVHRDSDPRVQSNARALKKKLESDPTLNDEWNVTQCSCSMVGWVDHLSFHAIDAENKPTRIFRFLKQWFEDLKDDIECNGGVADEADLDSLVHELSIRHFPHICRTSSSTTRQMAGSPHCTTNYATTVTTTHLKSCTQAKMKSSPFSKTLVGSKKPKVIPMPTTLIQKYEDQLSNLMRNAQIKQLGEDFFKILKEHNARNYEALIKVTDCEPESVDTSEYEYGTDYELMSIYETESGTEIAPNELEEKQEETNEALEEAEAELAEQEKLIEEINEAVMTKKERKIELEAANAELEVRKKAVSKAQDAVDELSYAERHGPGVADNYWNTVWLYSRIDETVARRLHLGVGKFTDKHDDAEFIYLRGCGMNMEPALCAYEALVYGGVTESHVSQFRDIGYFEHACGGGSEVFKEVMKILGIDECIGEMTKAQNDRMKAFDEACKQAVEIRKSLTSKDGDDSLGRMAAMLVLAKHMPWQAQPLLPIGC